MNQKNLKPEEISKICGSAYLRKMNGRDTVYLCAKHVGTYKQKISVPILLDKDICVASRFFSTGHNNLSVNNEFNRMFDCSHREPA